MSTTISLVAWRCIPRVRVSHSTHRKPIVKRASCLSVSVMNPGFLLVISL